MLKRIGLVLSLALMASAAKADTVYNFTISGTDTASGSLTLDPGSWRGCPETPGSGWISSMTGIFDGSPITFLGTSTIGIGQCGGPEVFDYRMDLATGSTTTFLANGITWFMQDNSFQTPPGTGSSSGNFFLFSSDGFYATANITIVLDPPDPFVSTPESSSGLLLLLGLTVLLLILQGNRNLPKLRRLAGGTHSIDSIATRIRRLPNL